MNLIDLKPRINGVENDCDKPSIKKPSQSPTECIQFADIVKKAQRRATLDADPYLNCFPLK